MALARCILGKFLGVGCHCFPPYLYISLKKLSLKIIDRGVNGLMWGGGGVANSTMGIRKFNSRRSQVRKRKKIFPFNSVTICWGDLAPLPQVMPMIPYTTKSKGVFLTIGWYLALSEGYFPFYSVHGTSISHGCMFVITRI